jgi:hypothetical protein
LPISVTLPVDYKQVMDGLKRAPSLRIVSIPFYYFDNSLFRPLAENQSMKEIRLMLPPLNRENMNFDYSVHNMNLDPKVQDLVVPQPSTVVPTNCSPNISSPSDPLFKPMADVDDNVHDTIWDRILRFTLEADAYEHGSECFAGWLLLQLTRTRTSVPQVSKLFQVIPFHSLASLSNSLTLETLRSLYLRFSDLSDTRRNHHIRK